MVRGGERPAVGEEIQNHCKVTEKHKGNQPESGDIAEKYLNCLAGSSQSAA